MQLHSEMSKQEQQHQQQQQQPGNPNRHHQALLSSMSAILPPPPQVDALGHHHHPLHQYQPSSSSGDGLASPTNLLHHQMLSEHSRAGQNGLLLPMTAAALMGQHHQDQLLRSMALQSGPNSSIGMAYHLLAKRAAEASAAAVAAAAAERSDSKSSGLDGLNRDRAEEEASDDDDDDDGRDEAGRGDYAEEEGSLAGCQDDNQNGPLESDVETETETIEEV